MYGPARVTPDPSSVNRRPKRKRLSARTHTRHPFRRPFYRVKPRMFRGISEHNEVVKVVIRAIPITVMHDLAGDE